MTYIVVKSFAQVGYVNWYIISMGIIRTTQKPFLFPYVNFSKKASLSTLSGNLWTVSEREDMSSLIKRRSPPPIEQRSNLYGFENPTNKNWVVVKESSSFVSYTSKTSTLLITCDARNWNLFLIEFMLISAKMGQSGFSSLNDLD